MTIKYQLLLPLVLTIIDQLCGSILFTKLDLHSAFNLACICTGDEWTTVFSTTLGHYCYNIMAYCLVNAPVVFQSFMDEVF